MDQNTKAKVITGLAIVGGVTVGYFGLRTVAVVSDPDVHKAVGNVGKAVFKAGKAAVKRQAAASTK